MPHEKLYVDPLLPACLPDLTLLEFQVGRQKFDIRFWRDGDQTQFKVLNGDPKAVVKSSFGVHFIRAVYGRRNQSTGSLTSSDAGFAEPGKRLTG